MCRYTFHHYTRCGHICSFDIQSCVEFLDLLRRSSQPGSNYPELSCTNIKVEHGLFSTEEEVYCLQCDLDWPEQVSENGTKKRARSIPGYVPIEGLESEDPIITAKMQWLVPKSRKREFDDAFLDLDRHGDHKSDGSDGSTVKTSTIANVSPSSTEIFDEFIDVPLNAHNYAAADEDEVEYEDEEEYGPSSAKKRNNSISEDYMVIDTDIPNTQAERVVTTSRANGAEDSDEDEDDFFSLWLSDSDSDSGDAEDNTGPIMRFGNTGDDTESIRCQLERFTFTCPVPRSTPRTPDSPPCSPRTRPRPERLPLYVGFPGQPPEKSPLTRRPSSRGNYVDARTELQSPVFDGFPGIFPAEDEVGYLRSPGLVSFPRFVEEKEKVEAGKSTGTVLGLCRARFASGSARAAAVLKGLNVAMPRK